MSRSDIINKTTVDEQREGECHPRKRLFKTGFLLVHHEPHVQTYQPMTQLLCVPFDAIRINIPITKTKKQKMKANALAG